MGRAPCCEKVGLKRGRWTEEEDQILTNYIQANGEGSWRSLPKNAGLLRCGKSCRLRWLNYLRSNLKRGNMSSQEEQIIVQLHASLGNRWSLIAGHLPGRTDNEIKNYWNSHLSRRLYSFRLTDPHFTSSEAAQNKRRGCRTSQSANVPKSKEQMEEICDGNAAVPMPSSEKKPLSSTIPWPDLSVIEEVTETLDMPSSRAGSGQEMEENNEGIGTVDASGSDHKARGGGGNITHGILPTDILGTSSAENRFEWDDTINCGNELRGQEETTFSGLLDNHNNVCGERDFDDEVGFQIDTNAILTWLLS